MQSRWKQPEFQISLVQILKAVIATTAAWWVSVNILDTGFPFIAPWTALMTIQVTTLRTISHGMQTTVASFLGIAVTLVVGEVLGLSVWSYALALLVGLIIARLRWIRDEGIAVATTSIFILSDGFTEESQQFSERMVEIIAGVAIGIAVNVLIFPPVRDRQATTYVDSVTCRLGTVLESIGSTVASSWNAEYADDWIREIESVDSDLASARSTVDFARESRRANPHRYLRIIRKPRADVREPEGAGRFSWEDVLELTKDGLAHLRAITRLLYDTSNSDVVWDDRFRERWSAIARDAGTALAEPDAKIDVPGLHQRLDQLATDMSEDHDLHTKLWPVYGTLITDLRHLITIVHELASSTADLKD